MLPTARLGHVWSFHCVRAWMRSHRGRAMPLIVALSVWCLSASNAFAQGPARIVMRVYDAVGVSHPSLGRAELTIRELLADAGVDPAWRNCRVPETPSTSATDSCADVLIPSEFIIRIVRAPRSVADAEVLGYSYVDPYRRQGTLATVFADRVRALASALQIEEGTLLGRAITHEVGHLLLGTLSHSGQGLMRGRWSNQGGPADWLFSATQAQEIRGALVARVNGGAPAIALARSPR